ncbi:hypothetical protein TNCV_1752381 [Trichonephila clavipes]|nr:hypothetical protein TNCV_1752381 [Trichonephila clavipes]
MVPVDADTVCLSDENESPVRAGGVLNGQDKTIHDTSPSVILNDPRSAFPLTIPDDPEPEEGDHSDLSPNNRKFVWVVKPVNRLKI